MREGVYTFFHSIWPNSLLKLRFVTFKLGIFQCILHYKNLNLNITNLNLNSDFGHIEWRKVYLQICCDLLILSPHGKDLVPLFCLMHISPTSGLEEHDHICHYQPLVASMMFQKVLLQLHRELLICDSYFHSPQDFTIRKSYTNKLGQSITLSNMATMFVLEVGKCLHWIPRPRKCGFSI